MPLYDLSESHSPMKLVLSISFLIIPLFDAIAAILRRLRKKKRIFDPDREHVHHTLMSFGFSTWQILFTLLGLTLLVCASALIWIVTLTAFSEYLLLGSWVVSLVFFLFLDRKLEPRKEKHRILILVPILYQYFIFSASNSNYNEYRVQFFISHNPHLLASPLLRFS